MREAALGAVSAAGFEVAGGSVPGAHHLRAGRNNQDAFAWARGPGGLVAAVADGCGSGEASELGARLGCRLLVSRLATRLGGGDPEALLEEVRGALLARFRILAEELSLAGAGTPDHPVGGIGGAAATLRDHLLFTLVGAAVTDEEVLVFALGDGVVAVNGSLCELGPFPENRPPFLAYGLSGGEGPRFRGIERRSSGETDSILLGTDGVGDWIARADETLPGRDEPLGGLEQFWRQDRYFQNRDMIRRRLVLASRGPGPGRLPDDTTLVVLRRRQDDRHEPGRGASWTST